MSLQSKDSDAGHHKARYRCPHCNQTSSRKWNLKTHIHRIHQGISSDPTSPQFIPYRPNLPNDRYYYHDSKYGQTRPGNTSFFSDVRYNRMVKEFPHKKKEIP